MDVVVAGGHGKVAQRLLARLAAADHRARGLIRSPDHAADLERLGAEAVLCDLEREDPRPHLGGADAIVFAAGAGPGSGAERKRTVDYGAAVKLAQAALELGVGRYVMLSAMGTADVERAPEGMQPYLRAKADADEELRNSGLDWTIVRPGSLTDDPGTGRIDAARTLGRRGEIPRDDVAATLHACLEEPHTIHVEFQELAGEVPVREALRAL
jgi:uncharacterized protein YbjT (DUF2867 family)